MSRNYGAGSRDMNKAAGKLLRNAVMRKEISHATAKTNAERFVHFVRYAKAHGIGRLERITSELIEEYGQRLAEKVLMGEMAASYAQNLLSSVNSVMSIATNGQWKSVSPTLDCNIPKRCFVRSGPTPKPDVIVEAIVAMKAQGLVRSASVAELAFQFGLRSREASMLDSVRALEESKANGEITIVAGTKGRLTRTVHVRHCAQTEALAKAAGIQNKGRCLIPSEINWIQWKNGELRQGREALKSHGIGGYHELRASYAAIRYQEIVGHAAPCNGGTITDKELDMKARLEIAVELGHSRPQIMAEYIGGRA